MRDLEELALDWYPTQDVCPANLSDHLAVGSYDPATFAIAVDALTHTGPAEQARVSTEACSKQFMPGVDPKKFPGNYTNMLNTITAELATYPRVSSEPPLKSYVYAK